MSDIKIQPSATGSATVTLTAPATGTARTVTLPDSTATIATTTDVAAKAPIASPEFTGNVGVQVTPENWNGARPSLQIGSTGSISGKNDVTDNHMNVTANAFLNRTSLSTGWDYMYTNKATNYYQQDGKHVFRTAPSGSADSAISWTTAMTIDNNGIVTKPNQPVFDVYFSSSGTKSQGTIVHDGTVVDIGGNHSTSNGRFTAPVAGTYYFYTTFIKANTNTTSRRYIQKNGSSFANGRHLRLDSGSSYGDNGTLAITVTLSAGDYVSVYQSDTDSYGEGYDYFGGHLIG